MYLLGIDVGTTHCKAGLFAEDGAVLALASRPTLTRRSAAGLPYYDPDELWATVAAAVGEAAAAAPAAARQTGAIGIASMAETGLLLDRRTGAPRSEFIPWFDTRSMAQYLAIEQAGDAHTRFCRTGAHLTFKCPLARLLWLRQQAERPGERGAAAGRAALDGCVWLSAADYVAYRLTGAIATDYSLAGRTCAFCVDSKTWDDAWLRRWDLDPALFPPAYPSGAPVGALGRAAAEPLGLPAGAPVAVAGHDHVCGALAVGAIQPGLVFDSMGTAETLVGTLSARSLGDAEFTSGLAYGRHVADGRYYWMGGLSASGGSIEWLRSQLGAAPLSYDEIAALLAQTDDGPGSILYFPYLLGSGAPQPDAAARGAFIGLSATHGKADLLRAVLEGVAYEMESIRRAAQTATGAPIDRMIAAGGGTHFRRWLQIKADVSGLRIDVPATPEATLLGAALAVGVGAGFYPDHAAAAAAATAAWDGVQTVEPDPARHAAYLQLYEQGYLRLQDPLRAYYRSLA